MIGLSYTGPACHDLTAAIVSGGEKMKGFQSRFRTESAKLSKLGGDQSIFSPCRVSSGVWARVKTKMAMVTPQTLKLSQSS